MYHHIFVRHLSTDKNAPDYNNSKELQEKVLSQKNQELPVNDKGHEQGRLLEKDFASYAEDKNISGSLVFLHSGYERTKVTFDYIKKSIDSHEALSVAKVIVDERLRDIDHGKANDIPFDHIKVAFPEYAEQIERVGYLDARPPEGETHRQALGRIREYLDDISRMNQHTVTITHLSTLIIIRWILEGLHDEEMLELLSNNHAPNGSLTHYIYIPQGNIWKPIEIHKEPWKDK